MINSFSGEHEFLSNFARCLILVHKTTYSSVEHAYQASKTTDAAERERIRNAPTAAEAKKLGKKVTLRPDWDACKDRVMKELIRQKFSPVLNPLYAKALLATGDAELIEGNWWGDTYWGVCKGIGENRLGKLLMDRREWLRRKGNKDAKEGHTT